MGDFTRVKSPMSFHGRFYLSGNTLDYKMTHWLFTLLQIISNILTSSLLTFSVTYTFYFYIAFVELTFYQKCSIKCVLYSLFYPRKTCQLWHFSSMHLCPKYLLSKVWLHLWLILPQHNSVLYNCILCPTQSHGPDLCSTAHSLTNMYLVTYPGRWRKQNSTKLLQSRKGNPKIIDV